MHNYAKGYCECQYLQKHTFTTKRSDIFTKNLINQLAVVAGVCAQVAFNFPLNDLIYMKIENYRLG